MSWQLGRITIYVSPLSEKDRERLDNRKLIDLFTKRNRDKNPYNREKLIKDLYECYWNSFERFINNTKDPKKNMNAKWNLDI